MCILEERVEPVREICTLVPVTFQLGFAYFDQKNKPA